MLTALQDSLSIKVLAHAAEKADGPFSCPTCRKAVLLHKGRIRVHHFKHATSATCPRGAGESEAHYHCKTEIYRALATRPDVTHLELEKDFGMSIADVFAVIRGIPVAIEVQKSTLSPQAISQRTANYAQLGIYVLWIGLGAGPLPTVYRPKAWELWAHAAYLGRVYYWFGGTSLHAVHFAPHSTIVESKTIFRPGGYEQSVGGYERFHKAEKRPVYGKLVDLAEHFRPVTQNAYDTKSLSVPSRKIYIDRNARWW